MGSADNDKTHWWTWVQFVVLCVSLVVNAILWIRADRLKAAALIADYNDRAWKAVSDFEQKSLDDSRTEPLQLPQDWTSSRVIKDWMAETQKANQDWADRTGRLVAELGSKLVSYRSAGFGSLPAEEFAARYLRKARSPDEYALAEVELRVSGARDYVEIYSNIAPAPHPHPGEREAHTRLLRFEEAGKMAREALEARISANREQALASWPGELPAIPHNPQLHRTTSALRSPVAR